MNSHKYFRLASRYSRAGAKHMRNGFARAYSAVPLAANFNSLKDVEDFALAFSGLPNLARHSVVNKPIVLVKVGGEIITKVVRAMTLACSA
jgi:hypothetical protein